MKKDEQAKLRSIYDQIENLKSQLEDLTDEVDDEDEAEILNTASEEMDDVISTLEELDGLEGLHISITSASAGDAIKTLEALLHAAVEGEAAEEEEAQ